MKEDPHPRKTNYTIEPPCLAAHSQAAFCSNSQIYEFHIPLRKYMALVEQGHDKSRTDQYLNEKLFGKFLGLFFFLSPWMQYLRSIDCPGPVVSQRLSPLTNPFRSMSANPTTPFLLIDWYASSHCNYTIGPAGHLFCYIQHLPKKKKISSLRKSLHIRVQPKHIKDQGNNSCGKTEALPFSHRFLVCSS